MIRRGAYASWLAALAFGLLLIVAGRTNGSSLLTLAVAMLAFQAMATIGVLIIRRDPGNAVGWIFCASALLMTFGNLAGAYGEYAANTNPGVLPGAVLAGWLGATWDMGMTLFVSFVVLLFPDGRLPSRRWRPVVWVGGIALAGAWLGLLLSPGHLDSPLQRYDNPFGVGGFQYLAVSAYLIPSVVVCGVAAAVVRYRGGDPLQRQQLKWFVAAVCASVAFVCFVVLLRTITGFDAPEVGFLVAVFSIPASVGVAILRHRLYDIDVIIRKTLVYVGVVVPLAAMYLSGVVVLGAVSRSATGQSGVLAVTLSTLAVAAPFQPLRRRVQTAVDRRFYRSKYDTARTLEGFSGRLRQQIDLEALQVEVLGVVQETLAPASATLWLRAAGGER